jgi:hypothetical protein
MPHYVTGDRVTHQQYGDGTVSRVDQYHTVIEFDGHGKRTFSSPRVVLSASSTIAPVKPAPRRRGRTSAKA